MYIHTTKFQFFFFLVAIQQHSVFNLFFPSWNSNTTIWSRANGQHGSKYLSRGKTSENMPHTVCC